MVFPSEGSRPAGVTTTGASVVCLIEKSAQNNSTHGLI